MTTTINYKKWVWLIHGLFWALLFLLSVLIFHVILDNAKVAFVASFINTSGWMILVYGHFLYLVPRFFEQKRYYFYAIGLVLLLVVSSSWRFFIGRALVIELGWNFGNEFTPTYWGAMLIGGMFILLISIPLRLIENWIKRKELEKELKTQQLEAELRFLKAQVNPHFLFNALNNIYSLSFMESKKTPEMILKLSDMMSYMLYDCKGEKVRLSSELEYLKNYIALQQLKKDGEQRIEMQVEGSVSSVMITPMLFIPFYENAFKHGNLEDTERGWLKSSFVVENGNIHFNIKNNLLTEKRKAKQGGVGLENVRKRLELLYPEKHTLKIEKTEDVFEVQLKIDL